MEKEYELHLQHYDTFYKKWMYCPFFDIYSNINIINHVENNNEKHRWRLVK